MRLRMAALLICAAVCAYGGQRRSSEERWIPLFNGKNLDGWTPKIAGLPLGEDPKQTFRVRDGVLQVSYDRYNEFSNAFGHLFHRRKLSHYVLRTEYRFVGEQCPGGPGWAFRNSGVMFHCQPPETMRVDQPFPVCIEAQLLGGDGTNQRPTNNVCTPGTLIVMDGQLRTEHCISSRSKTYHGDQWVRAEIEVHGAGKVIHRVEGETVLEYEQPQLDPDDPDAKKLIKDGKRLLEDGYIALQAESHPVEFRKVEVRILSRSGR